MAKPKAFKWAPYPVSKARNSYELLEEVCAVIKEEPRRYDQDTFGSGLRLRGYRATKERLEMGPACGTTACYAGWMVILRNGEIGGGAIWKKAIAMMPGELRDELYILFGSDLAYHLLTDKEQEQLGEDGWGPNYPESGTPLYAKLGIRNLRLFMKKHRKVLKAYKLERRPRAR